MAVFWMSVGVAALYAVVIASFSLSILAVFFAYRLSRITGRFGAWTLLIWGLVLTALEEFAYFGSIIFASYAKVQSTVEGYTLASFLFFALFAVAIPGFFFVAMYKMHEMFKSQERKPAARIRLENAPLNE